MQIVVNEQLKDAIEWTCKYASGYKVDIDIHIDADGEVSVSVTPTYRDRQDDVPEPCEVEIKALHKDYIKPYCKIDDTPQTGHYDYSKSEMENIKCGNGISRDILQTDCGWGKPTTVGSDEDKEV